MAQSPYQTSNIFRRQIQNDSKASAVFKYLKTHHYYCFIVLWSILVLIAGSFLFGMLLSDGNDIVFQEESIYSLKQAQQQRQQQQLELGDAPMIIVPPSTVEETPFQNVKGSNNNDNNNIQENENERKIATATSNNNDNSAEEIKQRQQQEVKKQEEKIRKMTEKNEPNVPKTKNSNDGGGGGGGLRSSGETVKATTTTTSQTVVTPKEKPPPPPPQEKPVTKEIEPRRRIMKNLGKLTAGVDLHGDSSTATVMGMATGYHLGIYEQFVGSLRKSGFKGHIILGVAPDVNDKIKAYFKYRNVTMKILQWTNCTYTKDASDQQDIFKKTTCAHPYPDIKIRWSRFPLARDWLNECKTCTGPVLITDVRDTIFQLDPFGPGSPVVKGLQVFEEHKNQTTQHWLTDVPYKQCKNYTAPPTQVMLCSGTTVGTRAAMLQYLEDMYEEMKIWIEDEKCRFNFNGDDQSIHNYLYYTGQLPYATAIPNRHGGIVNTAGVEGAVLFKQNAKMLAAQSGGKLTEKEARGQLYIGNNLDQPDGRRWIGKEFNIANDDGMFTEFDGSVSRVVHQFDRLGVAYIQKWMYRKPQRDMFRDPMPPEFYEPEVEAAAAKAKKEEASKIAQIQESKRVAQRSLQELKDGVDLRGDSSTATVVGIATGWYHMGIFEQFVGTLRKSGFKGHIILGVDPDVNDKVKAYLKYRDVTMKVLKWTNCTYASDKSAEEDVFKRTNCAHPYPDIKIRWSRFPLARDWLNECKTCTGPVLFTDVRDTIFQLDPFGPGSPVVKGLQVFEEHKNQTTQHWLTDVPFKQCKNYTAPPTQVMLCSGTTVGTRAAMLQYLQDMYEEMKIWIEDEKCRFNFNGDDESIHNYLYYTGKLPYATAIPNRNGGIVNTVGFDGELLFKQNAKMLAAQSGGKLTEKEARGKPYIGNNLDQPDGRRWIGKEFNIANDDGMFTEFDGSVSRVVHQFERFGDGYTKKWMNRKQQHDMLRDPMPPEFFEPETPSQAVIDSEAAAVAETTSAKAKKEEASKIAQIQESNRVAKRSLQELKAGVDLRGDSSTATVVGIATGWYHMGIFEQFVGTLRKSGFKGHIILGVDPDVNDKVKAYLKYRDVTMKVLKWTNCTYASDKSAEEDVFKRTNCAHPYPDIKIRWSRFPLARDWLNECKTCTGPVLFTDVRDTIFQLDPFGPGSPVVKGLQVYEEHKNQTTQHWLTDVPFKQCKNYTAPPTQVMLCSGTTVGTRAAMLQYLQDMYEEMKIWIEDEKCRFNFNGDDESIHNYLYYTGKLPYATAIPNRNGGIVNTVGFDGELLFKQNAKMLAAQSGGKLTEKEARGKPYIGNNLDQPDGRRWIGKEFNIANDDGMFTEFDGSVSRVVHQFERFGDGYTKKWMNRKQQHDMLRDPMPPEFYEPEVEAAAAKAKKEEASKIAQIQESKRVAKRSLQELKDGVDLRGDSSTATVVGIATGWYHMGIFEQFVGTLRKSGFKGHIILGVDPDVNDKVKAYLKYRDVTMKVLKWTNCTYASDKSAEEDVFKRTNCAHPYPDIKIRWSRFPLARDWLNECKTCTGPVLFTDVRDTIFQLDPFGPGSPVVKGLQVFEEHKNQTTQHWLTDVPFKQCKNYTAPPTQVMLCSGTTVGTRAAMLQYLQDMYEEMKIWIEDEKCRFNFNGDDESIHNYLYYTGKLPYATAIPNRNGGIVNTVGFDGELLFKQNAKMLAAQSGGKLTEKEARGKPYIGNNLDQPDGRRWIGAEFNIANDDGMFTEFDGSVSRVVHQFERFGDGYTKKWMNRKQQHDMLRDPMPLETLKPE